MDHERDDSDHPLPMPPDGHPLRALGTMLTNLLDEHAWVDAEHLLLTGWDQDRVDRETGAAWRKDNSLEVWFPITAEKLKPLTDEQIAAVAEKSIGYDGNGFQDVHSGDLRYFARMLEQAHGIEA